MRRLPAFLLLLWLPLAASAQMIVGQDTLYGNEWIDYDKTYYRIDVAEDGLYRIPYAQLQAAGLPVESTDARFYQLWSLGEQVPMYASAAGPLQPGDYLEFYGEQNRSQLDRFLFEDPSQMLNPYYSLYTDTLAYFLVVGEDLGVRYEEVSLTDVDGEVQELYQDTINIPFSDRPFSVFENGTDIELSTFGRGEGFGTALSSSFSYELPGVSNVQGDGNVHVRLISGARDHHLLVRIDDETIYQDDNFPEYKILDINIPLSQQQLESGVELEVIGLIGNKDKYSVGYASIRCSRQYVFDSDNGEVLLPASSLPTSHEWRLPSEAGDAVVYDLINHHRFVVPYEENKIKWNLPPGNSARRLAFTAQSDIVNVVSELNSVSFASFETLQADYMILTHPNLREGQAIQSYVDYRSSEKGGGYDVHVVETPDVYQEFGYGLDQHALAIRNFANYLKSIDRLPEFVFLIGKGYEYGFSRRGESQFRSMNYVPPYGLPGSDELLFAGSNSSVAHCAVGRLLAENEQDIVNYLEKVKAYEALFDRPRTVQNYKWTKRIVHLVGSGDLEQEDLVDFMNGLAQIAKNNHWGAETNLYRKQSDQPISVSVNRQILDDLNKGALIKAFMGHGSVANTDFAMDDPEMFDYPPIFPMVFSLGCFTGQLYSPDRSVSEAFIRNANGGSVLYLASSRRGLTGMLNNLTSNIYGLAGGEMYGEEMGNVLNLAKKRLFGINLYVNSHRQQMNLHGDPAIRINGENAPDYVVDYESLNLSSTILSPLSEDITIQYDLVNIGAIGRDTVLLVDYSLTWPTGRTQVYRDSISTSGTYTRVESKLEFTDDLVEGEYRVVVTIDADNRVEERPQPEAETNNEAPAAQSPSFYVIRENVEASFPVDFGIVGNSMFTVTGHTSNAFSSQVDAFLLLFTTALFNSELLEQGTMNGVQGTFEWQPNIPNLDSTVYYWRVGAVNQEVNDTVWSTRSFLYKNESAVGWNQSHYFQYLDNEYERLRLDTASRQFKFGEILNNINARAVILSSTNNTRSRVFYNSDRIANITNNPSITLIVISPETGQVENVNSYRLSGNNHKREEAINFVKDIPMGAWCLVVTFHRPNQSFAFEDWSQDSIDYGDNLKTVLEAEGATMISQLIAQGESPYAFAFQKGVGPIEEVLAAPGEENAYIFFDFPVSAPGGKMTSSVIGPAQSWESLSVNGGIPFDSLSGKVTLYGLSTVTSDPVIIIDSLESVPFDLSFIDGEDYPYLRLGWLAVDSIQRTPDPFQYWRTTYKPLPDFYLQLNSELPDSLKEGQSFIFEVEVGNHGGYSTQDSLIAVVNWRKADNQIITSLRKFPAPPPGELVRFNTTMETTASPGDNQLVVQLNPDKVPQELRYDNNLGIRTINAAEDVRQPSIEITFDGRRIIDGDVVPAQPLVAIRLEDENTYLLLDDTTLFDLQLRLPDESLRRLYFSNNELSFQPAVSGEDNRATIEWRPEFIQEGEYELIVDAKDKTGNPSGVAALRQSFEVLLEEQLSNVLPYPNPFTTSTRFMYTYGGQQPPANFMLRIMTVSGRIVREVGQAEFGPIRFGTHLSDFAWDGTDQYGDHLANGVYLYQVFIEDEQGQEIGKYERGEIDGFFKGDIGKVVLMR